MPVLRNTLEGVSDDGVHVYEMIAKGYNTTKKLVERTAYSKSKVLKHIRELLDTQYIDQIGQGRGVYYKVRA